MFGLGGSSMSGSGFGTATGTTLGLGTVSFFSSSSSTLLKSLNEGNITVALSSSSGISLMGVIVAETA